MATTDKTPYELLGVPEDIDYVKLRTFYRIKIHEYRQKKISAVNFRRICRAYETLSDYDKRKEYDSQKKWVSELPVANYTPQQLAAEPDLFRDLKKRLENVNLTEINAKDPLTGHTTLYSAARAGNVEAVKFLTEHGAEPDLSQRTKSTALHVAAFYGHADVVRCLLESGADYRILNVGNRTAEQEAFNDDVTRAFTELKQIPYVRAAADELDWFRKNTLTQHQDADYFAQRQTLLHCASKKGYFDLVRWLVEERSVILDLIDVNENSALHLAAYGRHTTIVEYLLDRGCDSTLKNRWGTTAEEEGSKHGSLITDLFKCMRERDMFEMARTGKDWWFYYHFGDRSIDTIDSNGISLLYHACRFGQYSVAKWLLEHGANVNIQMDAQPRSTPLHGAKFRGHFSIVELLLEYGADVNIKNAFGATVFDEKISEEVDKDSSSKIKELLEQYQQYLKSDKLIDIYVYDDDDNGQDPTAKIKLALKDTYKDLLAALSTTPNSQNYYFSVARRRLHFKEEDTTIISAVCCARYAASKFIELPLRLTRHKITTKENNNDNHRSTRQDVKLDLRSFQKQFQSKSKDTSFELEAPLTEKKTVSVDGLTFTFSAGCIKDNIKFEVKTVSSANLQEFDLPGCICLFETHLYNDAPKLLELPLVSFTNEPHARLYTLATPSSYWFNSDTRRTRLPLIGGIHAFVRHIDIIPIVLTLPADMFIAAALDQPLQSRDKPVSCTCLILCEKDNRTFPHVAYHGTNIEAVRSILADGLIVPGTVTTSGKRINPPKNHIARDTKVFGVPDFAAAIFLSPSIHYSADPTYAITFADGDRQLIPVLECSVKSSSYATYACTVPGYTKQPDDDMKAIEWRVKDPASVQINAVLFITKNASISASKATRIAATS